MCSCNLKQATQAPNPDNRIIFTRKLVRGSRPHLKLRVESDAYTGNLYHAVQGFRGQSDSWSGL